MALNFMAIVAVAKDNYPRVSSCLKKYGVICRPPVFNKSSCTVEKILIKF